MSFPEFSRMQRNGVMQYIKLDMHQAMTLRYLTSSTPQKYSKPAVREILLIAGDIVRKGRYFRNEKMVILASIDGYLRCNSR